MEHDDGLVCAYALDGKGGGATLDWDGVRAWDPGRRMLWVHLDRQCEESRNWLTGESGLDETVSEAMLALGFVTGLLGVNLDGIPGRDHPLGFVVLCGLLVLFGFLELWLFKRLKWL